MKPATQIINGLTQDGQRRVNLLYIQKESPVPVSVSTLNTNTKTKESMRSIPVHNGTPNSIREKPPLSHLYSSSSVNPLNWASASMQKINSINDCV